MHRRRLLQLAALGSGALFAGCGGDGDGDGGGDTTTEQTTTEMLRPGGDTTTEGDNGTPTTTEEREEYDDVDQEFLLPSYRAVDDLDYHTFSKGGNYIWDNFTHEVGAWGPWAHPVYHGVGDLHLQQYADVVTADDRLEITVREDANWSNSDPVTGRDAIAGVIHDRLLGSANSFATVESDGPAQAQDAITDYTLDGKTAILHSDGGHFAEILDQNIWRRIVLEKGPRTHTGLEPYGEYVDRLFELMDQAVAGEVDPWSDGGTTSSNLYNEMFGLPQSDEFEELQQRFRDPDNVVTNGAWTLDEIRGDTDLIFVPNEHHRHADRINFNRVRIEMAIGADNIYQSLNVRRYDMAGRRMAAPPEHVIEAFPDTYDRHLVRDSDGRGLEINHTHTHVRDARVRQAIDAALDKERLCELSNPRTHVPIKVPSGDYWGVPQFISDEWIDENLQSYEYDTELAAELMREAGYEQDSDGMWVDGDGDVVQMPIYTTATSPQMEEGIVADLSEFGFDTALQTIEHALMESERDDGAIPMWPGGANAGFAYTAIAGYTAGNASYKYAHWHRNVMRRFAYFDGDVEENIDETPWDDNGWPTTRDPDDLEHLTVSVPPIGEFWASESEWEAHPVLSMTYRLDNATGQEAEELWRKLLWINNWHMPGIPWANTHSVYFVNTDNWHWPTDGTHWDYLNTSTNLTHESYHSWGDEIFANPENPK